MHLDWEKNGKTHIANKDFSGTVVEVERKVSPTLVSVSSNIQEQDGI